MGSALGTISIDFNAEVAKLVNGVERANKSLQSMGASIVSAELFVAAIERMGHAAYDAGRYVAEMIEQTVESDAAMYRMASALGVATDQLQGLESAAKITAGIDTETFSRGIIRMASEFQNAAAQGGEVNDAIEHLGLKAKDLAAEGPDKAFLDIVGAFEKIKDASTRLAIGKDIFGQREVRELLPLLSQGREKIEEMVNAAKASGAAISDMDAARVTAVAEEAAKLGEKFEGVKQSLTVALAPALMEILKDVQDLFPAAETMKTDFNKALDGICKGIGATLDFFQDLEIGGVAVFDDIIHAAAEAAEAIYKVAEVKMLADAKATGHGEVPQWIVDLKVKTEQAGLSLDTLRDKLAAREPASVGVDRYFKHIVDASNQAAATLEKNRIPVGANVSPDTYEAEKAIRKLRDELQAGINTTGMTDLEKKVAALKKQFVDMPDSVKASIASLKELAGIQEAMNKQQDDIKKIKELADQARSPFEKWNEEIAKMTELLKQHKITQDQFDLAKKKVTDDTFKGTGGSAVAAMTRRFDFAMPGNHTSDPAQELRQKQLDEAKKQTQGLDDIEDNTKKLNDKIGGVVRDFA